MTNLTNTIDTKELILIEEGKVYTEEQADLIFESIMATWPEEEEEKNEQDEEIKEGDEVSFHGSVRISRGGKQIKNIYGDVLKVTEKAILVDNITDYGRVKVWVPKSAISNIERCSITNDIEGDLKSWFVKK